MYKNGGGAFLIPYLIAMIFVGVPMLYLESMTGQMHQRSLPYIFKRINNGFKILGVTYMIICFNFAGYYNIIMAYSYRFIFSAFQNPLPFANESAHEEHYYFADKILHKSASIAEFGSIQPSLLFLYLLSLYICYFIVKNGIKSTGKVTKITAIVPYIFFFILMMKGFSLDGSDDGLKYLFEPDLTKLATVTIWIDAIVQVFYQMGIGSSVLLNLSSMIKKQHPLVQSLYVIPVSLVVCGMLCAINVFMYLGHFCKMEGVDLHTLNLSGPELSFNIFPKALSILPWCNLWIILFFLCMVFLGIDTMFGALESIFCYLRD